MWYPNVDEKLYLKVQEQEFRKLYKAERVEKGADGRARWWTWGLGIVPCVAKMPLLGMIRRQVTSMRKRLPVSFL